ncbi:MAG: outer membrane protein assembly factor BamD [Candidatus Riflebacteria bacterium]|nr:outer membrane protein assembly factor BamD [Candidatus Riflebacteria bacterium]
MMNKTVFLTALALAATGAVFAAGAERSCDNGIQGNALIHQTCSDSGQTDISDNPRLNPRYSAQNRSNSLKSPSTPGYATADQLYQTGMKAYQSGDFATAGDTLRRLVEQFPFDSRAGESAFTSAESYKKNDNFSDATEMYRRVVSKYSSYSKVDEAAYDIGFCIMTLEDYMGAISEFRSFIGRYHHSEWLDNAWYSLGSAYESIEDKQDAIIAYRKVVNEFPGSDVHQQAWERLTALIGNGPPVPPNQPPNGPPNEPPSGPSGPPNQPPYSLSDQELYDRGHNELVLGNYDNAIAYFDRLLKQYPGSPLADDAMLWKGKVYLDLCDYYSGMQVFSTFKHTYGASELLPEACYSLAWCEYNFAKRDAMQRDYFQRAARDFSDFASRFGYHEWAPEALYLAGESYEFFGDMYNARNCYHEVVNRFPNSPSAIKAQDKLNGTY